MKKKIKNILFNIQPVVRVRTINFQDSNELKKNKSKFPFELENDVIVTVLTNILTEKFSFKIKKGYIWNGADIPRFLWRVVGSKTDNSFLIASMVHDYLLEHKKCVLNEILKDKITPDEYRKLTSIIFREIIKQSGTSKVKANIMSFSVDVYQKYFNRREWNLCK